MKELSKENYAKNYNKSKRHKKVLFADLDGTLIDTILGNTFNKNKKKKNKNNGRKEEEK